MIKSGGKLYLKQIVATFMCFFICISMSVLFTAGFTEDIGYIAYGTKEDDTEQVQLYTYYKADGEDTKKQEYEDKGYTVTTSAIRSELSGTGNTLFLIVTQIFCIVISASFIYPDMWQLGCKDSNLVRFKHREKDIFKGLKIGLIASVIPFIGFIFFVLCGVALMKSMPVAIYKFMCSQYYTFIELICGDAVTAGELGVLQYVLLFLLLFIVPVIAFGAYLLGYKDISLGEKFVYKKNKEKRV